LSYTEIVYNVEVVPSQVNKKVESGTFTLLLENIVFWVV